MSMFIKYASLSLMLYMYILNVNCENSTKKTYGYRFWGFNKHCYGEFGCFPVVSNCFPSLFGVFGFPSSPKSMNITFHVFTMSSINKSFIINHELKATDIRKAPISSKNLIIIIHGYGSKFAKDNWMSDMKNLILNKAVEDYTVICVDWSRGASVDNYQVARANTRVVGAVVGVLVVKLSKIHRIKIINVHLIGHSLGAHIAGYAAKKVTELTTKEIGWLTGLDPAGPCFSDNSLRSTDAIIVEAFHTDVALFGSVYLSGDFDVFVNNGEVQPTCIRNKIGKLTNPTQISKTGCDHTIITKFYSIDFELYGTCQPIAYACESFEKFVNGKCSSCDKGCQLMAMGFQIGNRELIPLDPRSQTVMFLKTSKSFPFCNYLYQIIFYYGSHGKYEHISIKFAVTFTGHRRKTMFTKVLEMHDKSKSYFLLEIPEKVNDGGSPGPLMTASIVYIWNPLELIDLNITRIEVNYMSSINETVRDEMSTELCPLYEEWADDVKELIGNPQKLYSICSDDEFEYDINIKQNQKITD